MEYLFAFSFSINILQLIFNYIIIKFDQKQYDEMRDLCRQSQKLAGDTIELNLRIESERLVLLKKIKEFEKANLLPQNKK